MENYSIGLRKETAYYAGHVNHIYTMLRGVYGDDFRLICVTDNVDGLNPDIEIFPISEKGKQFIQNNGGRYFKLFLFSREFQEAVAERFIYMDLDASICGPIDTLVDDTTDMVIMRGLYPEYPQLNFRAFARQIKRARSLMDVQIAFRHPHIRWCRYNSSFHSVRPFAANYIWEELDATQAKIDIRKQNLMGTDQAYLHLKLGGNIRVVGPEDGIWHFSHLSRFMQQSSTLPKDIKLVVFPGPPHLKPWHPAFREQHPWVCELYPDNLLLHDEYQPSSIKVA